MHLPLTSALYLGMVLAVFAVFMVTLGFTAWRVTWRKERGPTAPAKSEKVPTPYDIAA